MPPQAHRELQGKQNKTLVRQLSCSVSGDGTAPCVSGDGTAPCVSGDGTARCDLAADAGPGHRFMLGWPAMERGDPTAAHTLPKLNQDAGFDPSANYER